jgi:DNA-binding FadR family transcriptional regulator
MIIRMSKAAGMHSSVVELIAGWIAGGRFPPGTSIPIELELCSEIGVSRTVVREAVKTLVAKGLLSSGPRVGTRVLPTANWNLYDPQVIGWRMTAGVDDQFLRDLVDLRRAVEPAAGALAARHATDDDIALIQQSYRAMVKAATEGAGYLEADLGFHRAILQATHNQFFAALIPVVTAVLRVSISLSTKSASTIKASLPLHRAVADAIAARDPRSAMAALQGLIKSAEDDIYSDASPDPALIKGAA